MAWIFSQGKPMRSSTPGPKFSTSTSQVLISAVRTSLPFGFLVSSVIERLLWLSMVKYRLSTLGISCNCPRVMSPTPGRSTLITSAPNQANSCVQVGPDWTWVKSRMRTPFSALVIGLAPLNRCRRARKKRALPLVSRAQRIAKRCAAEPGSLRTPSLVRSRLCGASLRAAPRPGNASFLLQLALRVKVSDAAAFAARGGIEHCIDQRRLAGIHRGVHRALQLIRRGRVDACAAKGLHHPVVTRAFDEHGRRRIGACGIDVGAAIDAVVVEDDDADGQVVAADGFDFHAGEAECRVAFDR